MKLDNLKKATIEPFSIQLPRPLSVQELTAAMDGAVSRASIPNREKPNNFEFEIPLKSLFNVEVSPEDARPIICSPNQEAIDDQAVRWCVELTKLPPKALPRTQRPIINLLKRLPAKPTGQPAVDKGRRMILDRTNLSLWPAIVQSLNDALLIAATKNVPSNPLSPS